MRVWMTLGLMTVMACDGGAETTDSTADTDAASDTDTTSGEIVADAAAGAEVYGDACIVCHKVDGMGGGTHPDLVAYASANTAADVQDFVENGGSGMPAFGSTLTEQEIADVVAYVMSEFGGQ